MYMVLEPADSGLKAFDLIEEDEYLDYEEKYGYEVSEEKEIMMIIFMQLWVVKLSKRCSQELT